MELATVDALLRDSRLSDQARVLAFWIIRQEADEEGFVSASYGDLRPLLHGIPSTETVGRHVRMLEGCGWLERRLGGRGNPDRFRLAPPQNPPLNIAPPSNGGLKDYSPPVEHGAKKDSPPLEPGSKPDLGGTVGGEQLSKQQEVVAGTPPLPSPPPIDPKALAVIEARADDFDGCRGALRDYLEARVPKSRQYGYVQTLAVWLDGHDRSVFQTPTGAQLAKEDRLPILAAAMNELLAGDEAEMKRPIGDPGNLKTKVNVLILQRDDFRRPRQPKETGSRPPTQPEHNPISGDRNKRRRNGFS